MSHDDDDEQLDDTEAEDSFSSFLRLLGEDAEEDLNDSNEVLHPVFVYGSLKLGFGNDELLSTSEVVGAAVTIEPVYHMISLGGFPGVIKGGSKSIFGELYYVTDRILRCLDVLESNGRLYNRELIKVTDAGTGDDHQAWMYVLMGERYSDLEAQGLLEKPGPNSRIETLSAKDIDFEFHNWKRSPRFYADWD